MNLQPTLENDLICLRPLKTEDYENLYLAANDPLIWDQHPAKRHKPEIFKKFFEESIESEGALVVIDKKTNQVIGSSRYEVLKGNDQAIEIGWTFLSRKYWGGKYNSIMKKLMIDHALTSYNYVLLYIARNNIRSQMAAKKIGAKEISESYLFELRSENPDNLSFVISKSEWK